jgi:hypothetical protein
MILETCCVCGNPALLERFIDYDGGLRIKFIGINECPGIKQDKDSG